MRVERRARPCLPFHGCSPPLQNLYVQADVQLFGTPSYAEFGLVFRAQAGSSYQFKVNTDGQMDRRAPGRIRHVRAPHLAD